MAQLSGVNVLACLSKNDQGWYLKFDKDSINAMGFALSRSQLAMLDEEECPPENKDYLAYIQTGAIGDRIQNRQNKIDALLVDSRGANTLSNGNEDNSEMCDHCRPGDGTELAKRKPFMLCVNWEDNLDNACSNCIWNDRKAECSLNVANVKQRRNETRVQKKTNDKDDDRNARSGTRMLRAGKSIHLEELGQGNKSRPQN